MKPVTKGRANPRLLGGLLAGLVIVGTYVLVWQPQSDRMAEASEDRARVERELELTQPGAAAASATSTDLADRMEVAVPPSPALADLLRRLEDVATASGMATTTISPSTPVVAGGLTSITLSITASGQGGAAKEYVRLLGTLERALVIDQLSIQGAAAAGEAASGEVQLQATVRAFASATPSLPPAEPVAATTPAPSPSPSP